MQLKIDREFESKIPPLTAEEFRQLEENIVTDGVVINPPPCLLCNAVFVPDTPGNGKHQTAVCETAP